MIKLIYILLLFAQADDGQLMLDEPPEGLEVRLEESRGQPLRYDAESRSFTLEPPQPIEIIAPERVDTGSGLLRFEAVNVPDGATVTWYQLKPTEGEDTCRQFLENDGLTFGVAIPCQPCTIRVQVICWETQSFDFAETEVGGEGPPPPPPPPPADSFNVFIFEDVAARPPAQGDIWEVLQEHERKDKIMILPEKVSPELVVGKYRAMVDDLPGIVIDNDWDPSAVYYAGRCPLDADEILALVEKFRTKTPDPGQPVTKMPAVTDQGSGSQYKADDMAIETIDGVRYGFHRPTGRMWPIDEKGGYFWVTECRGGRCYRVKRFNVTTPKRRK